MLVERYNTKKYKIYQQENPADEEENDRRKHGFMDLYFSVHLGFEKTVTFSDEIIFNPIYINSSSFEFSFELPEKYKTNDKYCLYQFYLKVEIKSVYKGSKYSDTCISEMQAKTIH